MAAVMRGQQRKGFSSAKCKVCVRPGWAWVGRRWTLADNAHFQTFRTLASGLGLGRRHLLPWLCLQQVLALLRTPVLSGILMSFL
ncbi:hypothetical protein NDU88_004656 [Pleurodeles waltl]|uniref:Uncharacterized protein n=1 Tax=Pleurodeles waltl TaxID=8319 RepID=A0AAV7TS48_PLEWA|nr:hypothetical protein NDU88_004656 [Pleurodeles waltl]